jgi:hypothetical protein
MISVPYNRHFNYHSFAFEDQSMEGRRFWFAGCVDGADDVEIGEILAEHFGFY